MKNETVIGRITVGGQPTREELLSGRFGTVVNVRRDAEEGNITSEALDGSDVAYTSVPFTADSVTHDDLDRIADAVASSGGSVLIH